MGRSETVRTSETVRRARRREREDHVVRKARSDEARRGVVPQAMWDPTRGCTTPKVKGGGWVAGQPAGPTTSGGGGERVPWAPHEEHPNEGHQLGYPSNDRADRR